MSAQDKFLALASHAVLKNLELPCIYDIRNDDLFEISQEAFSFLLAIGRGQSPPIRSGDKEFIEYCLKEKLMTYSATPVTRSTSTSRSPLPSLRYLELQITDRCNLLCRHCYLGNSRHQDLSVEQILRVFHEFEEIQGLRLLLSGGEPLRHPRFWEINEALGDYAFRSVLLSNGTLLTKEAARRLRVHEVQLSIDGMKEGHDALRGPGTFEKVLRAMDHLREIGLRVSVATMIHRKNLHEFGELASLFESRQIEEWNVDVPCVEGRLRENDDLWVEPAVAGRYLNYGYGGGFHGSENNSTCGAHLCAIMANSDVCKCGLFSHEPVGSTEEGLRTCWERIPRVPLSDLKCDCHEIGACRGGCRYRAQIQGDRLGADFFQCYARDILKGGEGYDH